MQLKVKKHELRLLLQCIPILTFATLASLGSLLPSVVQFSAAVILAGQVVFIFGTKGIKKNIGLLWIPLMIFFYKGFTISKSDFLWWCGAKKLYSICT